MIPLKAQWVSFDVNKIESDNFKQQVEPFLKTISLSTSRHFIGQIEINKRIGLGVSYSQGFNLTTEEGSSDLMGGYPNLAGTFVVTNNLSLKGNLSLFKSGSDVVQSFSYGLGMNLTTREKNNWRLSALFSQLRGPDNLKNRSIDGVIIREFKVLNVPIFVGLGLNTFKTKLLIENKESIPNSIKGSAHHLLIGMQVTRGKLTILPVIQINNDIIVVSIELLGVFK